MTLLEWLPELKSLWTAWILLVFIGIVGWTLWPVRRERLEAHANIPLRDQPASGADRND